MKNDIFIENLNFNYDGTPVLKDVNLTYDVGDFLSIIGPNGGGKSTLLKLMIGLLSPTSGSILVFGKKPQEISQRISYVPQDTHVNKNFPISVRDVVLMGRLSKSKKLFGHSAKDQKIVEQMLEKVDMLPFANNSISALSGGQRQRVFIARALASEAEILFLDEPTASIDTSGQIAMFKLLKSLNKTVGIVIVSHDINVALNYATKIAHVDKTLYMHDAPIPQNTTLFDAQRTSKQHVCPVEIICATRCNHIHKELS
ncbi:MAG: ABC transporter ATP-binding protein [Sulfurospirillaceae bacterium]|nr:ABC transporter ATP-binding protein [Sulfurospirillaceae bacterium]